jgi:uncharacterized iron-regulated membrane protein
MNHIIGNEQFTVLKNTTYRRHIIQAVLLGAIVAVVIYGAVSWHNRRTALPLYDNITVPHEEVQRLAWTLAEALDPAVGQPLTYAQVMILLGADWQPLRDEIGLIINQ